MKQTTKTVWDDIISDYQEYGFKVEVVEDIFLALYFKDHKIATFFLDKITPEILRDGCKYYLANLSRGF